MLGVPLRYDGATRVRVDGRLLTLFAGNDYHRMSKHPAAIEAARATLEREGIASSGSRWTTGNHPLHSEVEEALAEWLRAEDVAIVSSGYMAGAAAMEALTADLAAIALAEPCHPSLRAAALASGLPIVRFPASHPAEVLDEVFENHEPTSLLLAVDSVEPNTGALTGFAEATRLARSVGAKVLIDDAHGVGVLGSRGAGAFEHAGLNRDQDIQIGTLGKAIGAFGGFVAGPRSFVDAVRRSSPSFIATTPIPLPIAAAALASIRILADDTRLLARLRAVTDRVRVAVRTARLPISETPTPIFSLAASADSEKERWHRRLLAEAIFPPHVRYPGCPPGGHFRLTLSSAHSDEEVASLVRALTKP